MEWDAIEMLIEPKLGLVLVACWVLGYILKKTPNVPDWLIIYVVTGSAILGACLLDGLTVGSVVQGILCGAVAVYGNQLVKQSKEAGRKDRLWP